MQEEEAHQAETFPEDPEEELLDEEMADDDERDDLEPSGPCEEADEEVLAPPLEDANPTPPEPQSDAITEEDALLMQPASQSEGPATRSHSPRSEAGTVLGELAGLSITSPSQPEPVEDETPQ